MKFCEGDRLRILAWNGEYSVALVFSDSADYERFYKRSGSSEVKGRFEWEDPIGTDGPKLLRVHKDASFDQRLRSQVFYNLRKEVVAHLGSMKVWDSDTMEVIGSGVKGTVFLTSGDEFYDLFNASRSIPIMGRVAATMSSLSMRHSCILGGWGRRWWTASWRGPWQGSRCLRGRR